MVLSQCTILLCSIWFGGGSLVVQCDSLRVKSVEAVANTYKYVHGIVLEW